MMQARDAPSKLYRGGEGELVRHRDEPQEADERLRGGQLERPQTEPAAVESALDARHQARALALGEGPRKVLHHLRIGVQGDERSEILRAPAPQQQTRRAQLSPRHGRRDCFGARPVYA